VPSGAAHDFRVIKYKKQIGRTLPRLVLPSILLDTFCEFISASATAKA
jgi:hypothetical protein